MRLFTSCILAMFCLIILTVPVRAQEDRLLRQNYTISINVECTKTAVEIINQLPGFNLDSSSSADHWQRVTEFRRRIPGETLRDIQETLRDLGEITFEWENAAHLGAQMSDLDVRIAVLDQELERLTAMMAASTTLEVLIAVNDRLSTVSWDRDNLIGRRNVLRVESQGPVIHITLLEDLPGPPPLAPLGFGQRISDRFGNSVTNTITGAQNFVVFAARTALPLIVWAAIFALVGFVAWRLLGRRIKLKIKSEQKEAAE